MTDRVVCDASAVLAVLLDAGSDGQWATAQLKDADLFAPALLPYECANVIRRAELSGAIGADQAAQAHADMIDLAVELWPYEVLGARAWELRANLPCYDAAYVALAETLAIPLVTLDRNILRAPGVACAVAVPGDGQGQ
ncbi:type II toxin-antitoxin system VapC family toxin [Mycobacterium palustre]|uniref:Ribonuclease VapC n=1 Tax=Mycobacterium palustre TaxID=153971 RepID=A0A1X1Z561_9MYCO|nr:type II toxin-antitoxin system VapC family toxin [Mycobacterium palustre]ORW18380.1 twitching motility protein PilT [Mycobacterium palustre]